MYSQRIMTSLENSRQARHQATYRTLICMPDSGLMHGGSSWIQLTAAPSSMIGMGQRKIVEETLTELLHSLDKRDSAALTAGSSSET